MNAFLTPEVEAAFQEREREVTLRKTRVGCIVGIVLVPIFTLLDRAMYPEQTGPFLAARIACSVLMFVLLMFTGSRIGLRFLHAQGLILLALPTMTISWMVYRTQGGASPYYAGLTLVLMILAVILDWTFWQSTVAVLIVFFCYYTACTLHGPVYDAGLFYNNFAFLGAPALVIMIGTYLHSRLRRREFASNYELDRNRKELAAQNVVLQSTLQQLKETESQLVQTEKIVSLGRLSAGLIHEINNPLNYATTGLYILKNQGARLASENPEEFTEVVQDINEGVERVKNIVSDLRTFSHPDADQREAVKVAEVITSSIRFLGSEWKKRVHIEHDVPPDLLCHANKNKLTQVFVNLIQNALDALKTRPPGDGPATIRITGLSENGRVLLRVRDNGEGIDPKNLQKIFDPFFTTRDIGHGMGMGLSICFRIIQEHQGVITVQSERGKFCEFTVDLPDARREALAA